MTSQVESNKNDGDTDRVVVGVLSRDRGGVLEYLLICSKKDFGEYTGFYYPPGGHVKEGDSVGSSLVREYKEELGIDIVAIKEVAKTTGDVKKQITHWWICEASSFDFDIQDEEIADAKWMTKDEITNSDKVWPATKIFFSDHV